MVRCYLDGKSHFMWLETIIDSGLNCVTTCGDIVPFDRIHIKPGPHGTWSVMLTSAPIPNPSANILS